MSSKLRLIATVAALIGLAHGQNASKDVRVLSTEGVTFRMPSGWEWQSEFATNIAIKKDIKVGTETYTVSAELLYEAEGYLEESITTIEKKVKASKGDLRDFKVDRAQKFGDMSAVLVSFIRVRGEDGKDISEERTWLFRRQNALYKWIENYNRAIASNALGLLSSARTAIVFTQPDVAKKGADRSFPEAGLKVVLPADFEWIGDAKPLPTDDKTGNNLATMKTLVAGKASSQYVVCSLHAQRWKGTLEDVIASSRNSFTENFSDVKDFLIDPKQTFRGEKALLVKFSGVYQKDPGRIVTAQWMIKRKGFLISWVEQTLAPVTPASEAALKKARAGLVML